MRGPSGKQKAFLAAYRITASVTLAAKAAKCERGMHYRWMDDATYADAFAKLRDEAADILEDEAVERATKGVFEPTVYQGEFTYPVTEKINRKTGEVTRTQSRTPVGMWKKSDAVLMFLLKGFKPEKYRESFKAEISGPGGGPILLKNEALKTLNDDELANLIGLTRKLASASADGSGVEAPPTE